MQTGANGVTYSEELDVVKNLVVEGEVVAGDDVDTSVLLDLPVLQTESLSLLQQVLAGDLLSPVCFGGFLEVTELSHTREAQNGAVISVSCEYPMRRGARLTIEPFWKVFV